MTEVHKMFQTIHQSEKLLVVESPPQLRTIKVDFSKTIVDENALAIFRYGNRS